MVHFNNLLVVVAILGGGASGAFPRGLGRDAVNDSRGHWGTGRLLLDWS
jgi:hypothetical protein